MVSGPNTMLGYLKDDQARLAAAAAGRMARHRRHRRPRRASGFITIKGRAKRFAKIAGEMISLSAVEALAADLWPNEISACATLPDERKGERIVHDHPAPQGADAGRVLRPSPSRSRSVRSDGAGGGRRRSPTIPLLGSGKLDYAGVKHLIEERAKKAQAA